MAPPRIDTSLELLLARHRRLDGECALATIVATAGSTYRKAGARMLIEPGGRITGLLSGGCLERDLGEHARGVLAGGEPIALEYDMRSDDDLIFGIGAGCEGAMRILVEDARPGSRGAVALGQVSAGLAAGTPQVLAVVHRGPPASLGTRIGNTAANGPLEAACAQALVAGESTTVRYPAGGGDGEAWVQYLAPAPRVLLCGAGPDSEPLAALIGLLGIPLTVTDHRPVYATAERFPGARVLLGPAASLGQRADLDGFAAAVVMSHHLSSDAEYLRQLAGSSVPYVGLLGPRARRQRLLADIGPAATALAARLRGPVGLDIGACTPEGIALAIAAEIHAAIAGRPLAASDRGASTR